MGGSQSHEFMVLSDASEDMVASCEKCGYAANLEKATSTLAKVVVKCRVTARRKKSIHRD